MATSTDDLTREFASGSDEPRVRYGGDVLRPVSDTVLESEAGGKLSKYRDLERDTQVAMVLEKRKGLVLSAEWEMRPASKAKWDVYAAEVCEEQLRQMDDFDGHVEEMLDAELMGRAIGETMWVRDGRSIVATEIRSRAPERFVRGRQGEIRMLTADAPQKGIEVPERKFIWNTWGGKYGDPYGRGLGYVWFYPVLFKRRGLSSWLQFAEKFGGPTTVTEYDATAPNADELRRMGVEIGMAVHQDTSVSVPKGLVVKFLEAARSGSIETYSQLVAYMDKHIALSGLGVTSTSDLGDNGARSAVESHQDEQTRLIGKKDSRRWAGTAKRDLLAPITYLNTGGKGKTPSMAYLFPQLDDLGARAERDVKVWSMGFEPSEEYINGTYEGDWTKRETAPPEPPAPAPAADRTIGRQPAAEFAEGDAAPSADELPDQAAAAEAAAMDVMLRPLRALVDGASSLAGIRDGIEALYGEMSEGETAEVMWQAMLLAEARGRADVMDETGA